MHQQLSQISSIQPLCLRKRNKPSKKARTKTQITMEEEDSLLDTSIIKDGHETNLVYNLNFSIQSDNNEEEEVTCKKCSLLGQYGDWMQTAMHLKNQNQWYKSKIKVLERKLRYIGQNNEISQSIERENSQKKLNDLKVQLKKKDKEIKDKDSFIFNILKNKQSYRVQ